MLPLLLALATQWTDVGTAVELVEPADAVRLKASTPLLFDGVAWDGGRIKRGGLGYLVLESGLPADATAADVSVIAPTGVVRTAGFAQRWKNNGGATPMSLQWDGTLNVERSIVVGPGTGSGSVSLTCAETSGMCYTVIQGKLPGLGQWPAIHGAVTVLNDVEMYEDEFPFQVKSGPSRTVFLVDGYGDLVVYGNEVRLGEGQAADVTIKAPSGLTLDPGATHWLNVDGTAGVRLTEPGAVFYGHHRQIILEAEPASVDLDPGEMQVWVDDEAEPPVMKIKVHAHGGGVFLGAIPLTPESP